MPLILAIEPDRRQTAQLVAIARGKLHVELVLADTTADAIAELGNRVPDLILTSALLSPKDDAALAECLRALDGAVAHVQTLTIPVLATPTARRRASKGMLSRLRGSRTHAAPEGCDPEVFADQIGEYLRRSGEERQSREEEAVEAPTTIGELVGLEVAAAVAVPERPEAADRSVFAGAGPRDVLPPGGDVTSTHRSAPAEEGPVAGDTTPPDAPGPSDHAWLARRLAPAEEAPSVAGVVTPPAALGLAEHAPLAQRLAPAEDLSVVGDVEPAGNVSPAGSRRFAADVAPHVREAVAGEVTVVEEASATCAAGTCKIDNPASEMRPLPTVTVVIDERERQRVPSFPTASSAQPITSGAVVVPVPSMPPIARASAVVPVPPMPPIARASAVVPGPPTPPIARVAAVVPVPTPPVASVSAVVPGPPTPPIARVAAVVPVPTPPVARASAVVPVPTPPVASASAVVPGPPTPPIARASAVVPVPPPPVARVAVVPVPLPPSGEAPPDAQPSEPAARPKWLVTMEELERQIEGLQQLSIQSPPFPERTVAPPPEPPERAAPGTPDVRERVKPGRRTARPRKQDRPVQDEWGFFDPAQCGFAALLTKLDEVTEDADNTSKPPARRTR